MAEIGASNELLTHSKIDWKRSRKERAKTWKKIDAHTQTHWDSGNSTPVAFLCNVTAHSVSISICVCVWVEQWRVLIDSFSNCFNHKLYLHKNAPSFLIIFYYVIIVVRTVVLVYYCIINLMITNELNVAEKWCDSESNQPKRERMKKKKRNVLHGERIKRATAASMKSHQAIRADSLVIKTN